MTFIIGGMDCNHCRSAVTRAIQTVEGVTSVTVDLQQKKAFVKGEATAEAICKAVEEIGFTCSPA